MAQAKKMTEQEVKSLLAREISAAQTYDSTELKEKRERALGYYNGEMTDTPPPPNRSKAVSKDVSDIIGWILPSLMRVFTASENMGLYEPVKKGDEAAAAQATEYINYKFWKSHSGYRVVWDACHDALLLQNGIIKHWWDESKECEYSTHTSLNEEQLTILVSEDGVEVKTATENEDGTFDVKIERTMIDGAMRLDVVPPENFLIDDTSEYIDEKETRFCGERKEMTRSDLVKMGFDKTIVDDIPAYSSGTTDSEIDDARKTDIVVADGDTTDRSMQTVEVFECYLLADVDGDGIAERVRAYLGGSGENGKLLDWDVWDDDLPFTDLVASRVPHRWEGQSIADDTMDVQQIKTVLMRQSLDNVYAHNNPQREIEAGSVINPDQLTNPQFGGVIQLKKGATPIINHVVPFTADKSFMALEYFDQVTERRTGVSRSTMALDPEALQNQTATAVNAQKDSSYSKVELIARNMAEMGFKRLFKMMLRIYVKHQQKPDIIRLREEWVEMDPRHWNSSMDVTIDTGLGTGSRDRDVAILGDVLGKQIMITDRLAESGFSEQALGMLPKIQRTLIKQAESAGLKSPDEYFPEVSQELLQSMNEQLQKQKEGGDPAAQKAQAEMKMKMELAKLDAQMKQQAAQQQNQLDVQKMQAEFQMKEQQFTVEMQMREREFNSEMALKERQLVAELELKREQMMMGMAAGTNGSQPVRIGGEPG